MNPEKMALVQPASLQLFQKLAESMLGSGAVREETEASGGDEIGCGGEVETPGTSVWLGRGGGTSAVGEAGRWTGMGSSLLCTKRQRGMTAHLTALK